MKHTSKSVRLAGLLSGAALLLGGMSAPAFAAKPPPGLLSGVAQDKALSAKVISSIRKKGTIVVAADASYAPNEFMQGGSIVGMDADLATAIGVVLGLRVQLVNETFDGIIPGLQAKRYDLGMSSFTDNKSREGTVDFVDYFTAGTSFFVKASSGPNIETLANLCGHTVAVETGTTQQTDATNQSKACTKAGKKAVTVDAYPDQTKANLALSSGRDQVSMADSPVAAYQVKLSKGVFKLSGKAYGAAPYGIAIPKHNGMARVIQAAVKDLIKDGAYLKIMTKWGVQAGDVTAAQVKINGATS